MSSDESDDGGPGRREVAYRLFAAEFEDTDFSYAESDEERAPNYVVTPTGARVNRMFVVGVLTQVEEVGNDILRARVVDPTGAVVVYAGQYQPEAQTFFERAEPPMFLAVSGKARTFQPEDSGVIYTSLRPESVNTVDAETRDRWTVQTAEQTLQRIGAMASGIDADARGDNLRAALEDADVDEALAAGIPLAIDHYGTTGTYLSALRDLALDATRVVAGTREEAGQLTTDPGDGGNDDVPVLASMSLETDSTVESPTATASTTTAGSDPPTGSETTKPEPDTSPEPQSTADTSTEPTETDAEPTTATTAPESAAATPSEPTASTDTSAESTTDDDDIGDFEPGEFDLDEETREEVESEYGTDFQSGTEVEDPGEAGIDTPDPEELSEAADEVPEASAADVETATTEDFADTEQGTESSSDAPTGTESPDTGADATSSDLSEPEPTTAETTSSAPDTDTPAENVDLEDAAMDAIEELDDGSGADREAVVEAVVDRTGADVEAVEDGIQSALMSGRCYEPDDTTLKSI